MALGYVAANRNARMDVVRDAADAGAGAALLRLYDGTRPATGGAATNLLAELTMSDPSAPNADGGVSTYSAITTDASANGTGTATWFRVVDSDGGVVMDGSVGTSGSDLNLLGTTAIVTGQPVEITSFMLTEGNA